MRSRSIIVVAILGAIAAFGMFNSSVTEAKEKPRSQFPVVGCANRVFTVTKPIPVEERNAFLVSAMEKFKADQLAQGKVTTPEEEAAFVEEVKQNSPVEVGITTVMSDKPSLLPATQVDTDDGKLKRFKNRDSFDNFAEKVKQSKCRSSAPTTTDLNMSSVATAAAWQPTWYYCTAEAYGKNIFGNKIIRLVQRQDWLVSIYGTVQDHDPIDVETYAYLSWRVNGQTATVGPKYDPFPWAVYASAKQKFVNSFRIYDIQTRYLSTWIRVGPGSDCQVSPGWGPGMPGY